MNNDVLELETRRKIYDLVAKNPGLHLSKIADLLNMRVSLAEYHLLYLEKNQMVTPVSESGYTRYYVKGGIGTEDKRVLALLRQDVPLRIILLLLKCVSSQHKELLQNIDVAPSTLSYHLKKLVACGIISVQTYGEERGYSVINKEMITRLLIQYKPYNLIESFKDVWTDLTVE
jgi:predicted transcriptional regulator